MTADVAVLETGDRRRLLLNSFYTTSWDTNPLESTGRQTITRALVRKFAAAARERIRIAGGGYRRDHLRALAERIEVADREVRIIGSKSNLPHTAAAALGARPPSSGVRSSVPKWRPVGDSNPCCRRERAVSWASRRTGQAERAY